MANWCIWQTGAYGELAHMANLLVWRTDCGELAYGETTPYHLQINTKSAKKAD